jgi:uncharacterized protein (TIGR02231 family)
MKLEWILLGCCLPAFALMAREVTSTITDVTIYNNMALLQRQIKVNLAAGENIIEIGHLPTALLDESVHIGLADEAQVQIQDVKVERWFLEKPEEVQTKKLEEEIAELDRQDKQFENEIKSLKNQEKFLVSIQVASDARTSQELLQGKMDVTTLNSTMVFLRKNLTEVYNAISDLELKRKELESKREALKKQLQQVQSSQPKEEKSIQLILQARAAVSAQVTIAYLLQEVYWSPTYELRALPAKDQVEMVYSAEVHQKTGEDWSGISLNLSTATPAVGAQAPEMQPWYLNLYRPRPVRAMSKVAEAAPQVAMLAADEMAAGAGYAPAPSVVESKGVSVNFNISGKRDLPSGEDATKVLIHRHVFPATLSYLTIPKLATNAYLKGAFENTSEYPFIAGTALTYVDGDYVGKSDLLNKAVGEKVELSLGIDPNIKIKHEQIKRNERNKGMISKKTEVEFLYKITLENYHAKAIVLQVEDQAPISRNEEIEVADIKLTPAPAEWDKESGKLTWKIDLKSKEKKELFIGFVISYPRESIVSGL